MAHMLEERNGVVSFASVRETAWHGLGQILPDYLDIDGMLKAANLNWNVTCEPVINSVTGEPIPGYRATTRDVDGKALGIVGSRYTPFNNKLMMEMGQTILGDDEAKWETAGSLKGGTSVFALALLNQELYIAGDEIKPYFLLENSHDGSNPLRLTLTPTRVVCQNTLNLALRGSQRIVKIRHTQNYETRLGEAQRALGLVKQYYASFEERANQLLSQAFSKFQFENMLEELVPVTEDATPRIKNTAQTVRDNILECYMADDLNNIRGTAWGAFNAVADYSDHYQRTRGVKGRELAERRFENAFHDVGLKDRVLAILG